MMRPHWNDSRLTNTRGWKRCERTRRLQRFVDSKFRSQAAFAGPVSGTFLHEIPQWSTTPVTVAPLVYHAPVEARFSWSNGSVQLGKPFGTRPEMTRISPRGKTSGSFVGNLKTRLPVERLCPGGARKVNKRGNVSNARRWWTDRV